MTCPTCNAPTDGTITVDGQCWRCAYAACLASLPPFERSGAWYRAAQRRDDDAEYFAEYHDRLQAEWGRWPHGHGEWEANDGP